MKLKSDITVIRGEKEKEKEKRRDMQLCIIMQLELASILPHNNNYIIVRLSLLLKV